MTDAEIIRALGYCSNVEGPCKDCPFKYEKEYCVLTMTGYALDLIKRQQTEIEKLKESRDRWKQLAKDFDEDSRENEKELESLYAEIADLKTANFVKTDMINCLQEKFENAKTKAVKEFAESVKFFLIGWSTCLTDEEIEYTIDSLLKEKVGANNDR